MKNLTLVFATLVLLTQSCDEKTDRLRIILEVEIDEPISNYESVVVLSETDCTSCLFSRIE